MPFVYPQARRRPTFLVCLALSALTVAPSASAQQTGIDMPRPAFTPAAGAATDISFLVGTWHVSEVIYPGRENEYVETSVRVCEPALDDTYVICHTASSRRGQQRESIWLVSQPAAGEVQVYGFFSNIPDTSLYRGRFLPDGSGLALRSYDITEDTVVAGRFQRFRFRSADEFEWHIGIENMDTAEETIIGIERAVRVSDAPPSGSVRE